MRPGRGIAGAVRPPRRSRPAHRPAPRRRPRIRRRTHGRTAPADAAGGEAGVDAKRRVTCRNRRRRSAGGEDAGRGAPRARCDRLVVWGAAPAETRVNVDGVEIPALYHVGGLRSTVGADLVGDRPRARRVRRRVRPRARRPGAHRAAPARPAACTGLDADLLDARAWRASRTVRLVRRPLQLLDLCPRPPPTDVHARTTPAQSLLRSRATTTTSAQLRCHRDAGTWRTPSRPTISPAPIPQQRPQAGRCAPRPPTDCLMPLSSATTRLPTAPASCDAHASATTPARRPISASHPHRSRFLPQLGLRGALSPPGRPRHPDAGSTARHATSDVPPPAR